MRQPIKGTVCLGLILILTLVPASAGIEAQELEQPPIRYSTTEPRNPVEQLCRRLASGEQTLTFQAGTGYLRPLLEALEIPESSQVLVFSKTSMQRDRISPRTPRAVYYNDEVMVGFCQRGGVIEIATADERVGTAFYTLDQSKETDETPRAPERQSESCLACHASTPTRGFPGHLIRSLYVDSAGNPLLAHGSYHTDQTSPLGERWGGWYVTGTSGRQMHLGNHISDPGKRIEARDNQDGVNLVSVDTRFRATGYVSGHSDIVSLMVLEHQLGMLNRLSHASLETRRALEYEKELNRALNRPATEKSDSARSRIRSACEDVVRYMLFQGEVALTDRIQGTSTFTSDFRARGPFDSQGRSLRDFDLETRIFRHPCSYLIYSRAFDSLPDEARETIYRRLWDILTGQATRPNDPKLSESDRKAILEILRETKPNLPEYWKPVGTDEAGSPAQTP